MNKLNRAKELYKNYRSNTILDDRVIVLVPNRNLEASFYHILKLDEDLVFKIIGECKIKEHEGDFGEPLYDIVNNKTEVAIIKHPFNYYDNDQIDNEAFEFLEKIIDELIFDVKLK